MTYKHSISIEVIIKQAIENDRERDTANSLDPNTHNMCAMILKLVAAL